MLLLRFPYGRNPVLLIALLLLPVLLPSQYYPVSYLGMEQGLSNNSVMSIYQDKDGFMWFGTYDGLNRYDGYECRVFRNQIGDSTSLLTNTIYTIDGDEAGHIWVGGMKGACVYYPATASFRQLRYVAEGNTQPVLLHDNIQRIRAVNADMVLTGGQQTGLVLFENGNTTGTQIPLNTLPGNKCCYNVIAIDAAADKRSAWVFIQQSGLFRFDFATKQLNLVSNTLRHANCIRATADGNLWVGSNEGLARFNTVTGVYESGVLPGRNRVINLCEDRKHTLWIGTDDAGIFTWAGGVATPLPEKFALSPVTRSISVWGIYEDASGRKWIGTLRGGVSMIEAGPDYFTKVLYRTGKEQPVDNFIFSFCEDNRGQLWIGTDGAGLRCWNRQQNTYHNYIHVPGSAGGVSSNFVTSIIQDAGNDIWASTWSGGVNRITPGSFAVTRYACFNPYTGQEEKNVWVLCQDKQQQLWASATNHGSLYRFKKEANRFELFDTALADLQCLTETADGTFWGGSYSSLICIDRQQRRHVNFKMGYTIRCIVDDGNGFLWVGTQEGGLLHFNRRTGKYRRYSTADGLPGNTILRILTDARGDLWLSTYNGLSRFRFKEKRFTNYSYTDGLQSNQFSFNAAERLSTGELAFGGINGFNLFRPDSIHEQDLHAPILLNGLFVNNQPIEKSPRFVTERTVNGIHTIRLPYDQTTLSLNFVRLTFNGTDKTKYAFLLDGWDKEWHYINNARQASYSRLQEGTYTFKVRVADADGIWEEPVSLLTITVLPPWYRSWWAYILYIAAAAALVWVYRRYMHTQARLRYEVKLAHLESEKEKEIAERQLSVFTNISHEFRTPLTLIINPLKNAVAGLEQTPLQLELLTAQRNARRLLSLVDQLLLFKRADSGGDQLHITAFRLQELCQEVFLCFTQQAKTRGIDYTFSPARSSGNWYGDYEKLEIALFNLLSNAFKFTPDGGKITLDMQEEGENVAISITDTGCGISEAEQLRIFDKFHQVKASGRQQMGFGVGLYLVKHFTTLHGGNVFCTSTPGNGTVFTIRLPRQQAVPETTMEKPAAAEKTPVYLEELMDHTQVPEPVKVEAPVQHGLVAEELLTAKKSVLIVDDNEEMRNYLQLLFTPGYLVHVAASGEEGYQLAEKHKPDIVISDIFMQEMSGVDLCRRIKESESLAHIPVILLTATTSEELKLQGIEGGADDYLNKPFDSDILLARVETILKNQHQLRRYYLDSISLKEHSHKVPAEYQHFMQKCIEIIEENMENNDFNMKMFAREMGMSHSNLYTKVKAISGQSVTAFMRSVRIRRAAVLMLTENLSVKEAAFRVGIIDAKYFREQFVRIFEMTPSDYIKKYRYSFNRDLNTVPKDE